MADVITDRIPGITYVQTGRVQEIPFEAGMTIAQALRELGVKLSRGQEIRLNTDRSPIRTLPCHRAIS